jgi:hypothetical protein
VTFLSQRWAQIQPSYQFKNESQSRSDILQSIQGPNTTEKPGVQGPNYKDLYEPKGRAIEANNASSVLCDIILESEFKILISSWAVGRPAHLEVPEKEDSNSETHSIGGHWRSLLPLEQLRKKKQEMRIEPREEPFLFWQVIRSDYAP